MRARTAVVILLSMLMCVIAGSQEQQYSERVEVRLHNLDTVVTDREGKPVSGLTKEDFVVLENGVAQEITNFSVYDSSVSTVTIPESGEPGAAQPAQTQSASAPPPRRFVFFIDEMAIQGSARKKLTESALELLKIVRPGDLATVVRPTGTTRIVQDYTSDVAEVEKALRKAIDDCKIRLTAPAYAEFRRLRRELETAETPNAIAAAKRAYSDAATERVQHRLSQMRALIASMSSLEGKKVLVLITSGLSAHPGREVYGTDEQVKLREAPSGADIAAQGLGVTSSMDDNTDANGDPFIDGAPAVGGGFKAMLREDIRFAEGAKRWQDMDNLETGDFRAQIDSLARAAAADGTTIYALEPEVPLLLDATRGADSNTVGSTLLSMHADSEKVVPQEMLNQLLTYQGQTLTSLTEKTGGKWFRGVGAIDDTFRQVTSDLQVYYSIAYRSKSTTARARKIQVSVKGRPELRVRTRSEVIDRSNSGDLADRVVAGLLYPRETNELQMAVTTGEPKKDGRQYKVPVEVTIPVDKMSFVKSLAGTYKAIVSVHYATAKEGKEFFSYGKQEQIIELTPRQYAQMAKIRYRYRSDINVPKGNIRIALGIADATSKLSSLKTVSVKAP